MINYKSAESEGGYIFITHAHKIWVDEEYRGQGLGTLLLKHYEKKAREKGAVKFIAEEVYDWNVGFFLKNGYKIAGELSGMPKGHSYCVVDKDL